MRHGRFQVLVGVALVLLGSASGAQSRSGRTFSRVQKPLTSATFDLTTGTVTRGPAVRNRAASTVVDFHNMDLSGFIGLDTGGGFCEWIDAGVKGSKTGDGTAFVDSGHLSDLMNSIVFAYCSARLDPASGGPGGSVRLGFYEGYTQGGLSPSTAAAVFTLTGLPANTRSSSFFGGFNCYFMRVTFGALVPFADGPIGYSWRFLDSGTGVLNPLGTTLAATFPFLACVASCSGAGLPGLVDGQGMVNLIDEYCPPGTLRSVFSFGTSSSYTSVGLDIEEVAPVIGTVTASNSSAFPNPDILTSTPANVGQPFTASLKLGLTRTKGSFAWSLFFGSAAIASPTGVPTAQFFGMALNFGSGKAGRMLLCAFDAAGFSCSGSHTGVSGSISSTVCGGAIPPSLSLVCNEWCAQAVVLGGVLGDGNARLSSMVSGVIGTN